MKLLVLVLAASLGWTAGQQTALNPCANVNNGAVANGPPLPDLPTKSFKSVVRAVLLDRNMTIEAREYVSETANAATLVIMFQGQQDTILMDYNTDQTFYITPNPLPNVADTLCTVQNLSTDPSAVLFGSSPNPNTKMPHLYSLDKVLQLSKNSTLVYKGQKMEYDVLVDHWTTCLTWKSLNSTFTLDYYFTVPNYTTPSGSLPVPIAAEVRGVRSFANNTQYPFHHVYQYINFEPYVDDPESVFTTPPGVYCGGRMSTLPVPSMDSSFYYREEVSNPTLFTFTQASIWYDYDLKITRTDSRLYPSTQSTSLSMVGPYTVIHDYRTGVQYAIDNSNGACSIDPIPPTATGYDAVYNATTDTLNMRDPMQFFNLKGGDQIVWVGQRPVRGLQADVFQKFTDQLPGRGGVVYEVYFIKNALDATDVGRDAQANRSVPVLIMEWEDNALVNEYNIYDFDQDSPTYNVFDVSPCFSSGGSVDFEMAFSAPTTTSIPSETDLVMGLVRLNLALAVPMTPIRLQKTRLRWDSQYVYLEGTILDRAPPHTKYRYYSNIGMQASDGRQVPNIADVDSCADACQKLKDWNCTTFDYCPGSKMCILGKIVNNRQSMTLMNSTTCNHYASVVAGDYIAEPTLFYAWQAIQNTLYAPGLSIDVPLNASNLGLPTAQKVTLTALWIQNEAGSFGTRKNSSTGPPLPSLPMKAFKSTVRGIILNRNMTVVAREYVDEDANAATMVLRQAGQETTIIMSYNTNEIFYISDNPSPDGFKICQVSALSNDTNSQMFGVGPSNGTKMPHLFSTSKILDFAKQFGEVYKGMTFVEGVPTNRWTSSMYWSMLNSNFTLDYYFTVPNYTAPGGGQSIPVMAEVQGRTSFYNLTYWNFHHVYQYVDFQPYVDDPESQFNTPPGVFCIGRKNLKPLPTISKSFSYKQEVSDPTLSWIIESTVWYDYDLQLIRVDVREAPDVTSTPLSTVGPYSMIHDYGTGVQYTIDRSNGVCSIDPLPADAQGFDASLNITRGTLSMRNPLQLFNLLNDSQYVGQRTMRGGQQADVFQRLTTQLPGHGLVVYEVYFFNSTTVWTDVGIDANRRLPVPARIMEWENGKLVNEVNIYDFDQDTPPSDTYDLSPCFNNYQSIDFELAFTAKTTVPMPSIAKEAIGIIREAVAITAVMSPIRLQGTRLHWADQMVFLQGTIIDRAPPLAKYEYHPKQMMQTYSGKSAPNTVDARACASLCDGWKDWTCTSFDYCASQKMCSIGRPVPSNQLISLINNTNCDHYSRVVGNNAPIEPSLHDAWTSLKNAVYGKGIAVDLSLTGSFSTMVNSDTPQTLTLYAKWITDQVVSTVNRNSAGASLQQFQALPNTQGKGYDELLRGVSVDDCAKSCVSEQAFNCQSFAYCWEAGTCFLSSQHPDETPRELKKSPACDLYFRNYTSDYQRFDGQTVLSNSDTIYQNVFSDSSCAKLCTYYTSFSCKSFDYCPDLGTCFLGRQHFYDVPKANIQQVPGCNHYSRNYINEFLSTAHKTVQLRDNRIVVNVGAEECAKLCVEEPTFTCMSFDFCANISECRLSDASVSNTGQVTLDASAYCDVYSRQSTSGGSSSSSKSSSSGYSNGSMGGLGFAMLVVGLAVGAVAVFLYFRRKNLPGDGMQMSFTKLSSET